MQGQRFVKLKRLVRRLEDRLRYSPRRCAENLFRYLQHFVDRVGLRNGLIVAKLHESAEVTVEFATGELATGTTFRSGRRRRRAAAVSKPAATGRSSYSTEEILALLQVRMTRLLRHYDFSYGRVIVDIEDGQIVQITPAPSFRGNDCELPLLARFFTSAPPAALWCPGASGRPARSRRIA